MKKSFILITVILALALITTGVFVIAQRENRTLPPQQEVKNPAPSQNYVKEDWPKEIHADAGDQLPIPKEYYLEDGSVKPGYEERVWEWEYFGNPVRPEMMEEYLTYMEPKWEAMRAETRAKAEARYYEQRALKAARNEDDPYAGMTFDEYLEVSDLRFKKPWEWAVLCGQITEDSPRLTLEQARAIAAENTDYESIRAAIESIQPYEDVSNRGGEASPFVLSWYRIDEHHALKLFYQGSNYDSTLIKAYLKYYFFEGELDDKLYDIDMEGMECLETLFELTKD